MKKRCKRKVWALVNPIEMAVQGAAISGDKPLNKLRLAELSAIDEMVTGKGTTESWRWIADCINIAETLGKMGIGPEALPLCETAQKAMLEAADRYQKTKRMGLSGEGIKAVKELWEIHDLQRTSVARSVYEAAILKTANTIRSRGKDVVEIS